MGKHAWSSVLRLTLGSSAPSNASFAGKTHETWD